MGIPQNIIIWVHVPEELLSLQVAVPIPEVVVTSSVADVSEITFKDATDIPVTPELEKVGGVDIQVVDIPVNVHKVTAAVLRIAGETANDCAPTPAATPAQTSGSPNETNGDRAVGSIKVVSQS